MRLLCVSTPGARTKPIAQPGSPPITRSCEYSASAIASICTERPTPAPQIFSAATVADLGLTHKDIHEDTLLRTAAGRFFRDLRWDQIDFEAATLAVCRDKKGTPATHPIRGDELRALRRLAREQDPKSPFVFTSERGAPFTTAGFARMIERAGEAAGLDFKAHPHMLRHACGFALANKGHDTRALQGLSRA